MILLQLLLARLVADTSWLLTKRDGFRVDYYKMFIIIMECMNEWGKKKHTHRLFSSGHTKQSNNYSYHHWDGNTQHSSAHFVTHSNDKIKNSAIDRQVHYTLVFSYIRNEENVQNKNERNKIGQERAGYTG